MGNPGTVRALKQQVAALDPMVTFVSETRLYKNKVDNIRRKLGMAVEDGQQKFRFTGIYGQCQSTRKQETWSLIDRLKGQSNLPWLVGGDFNEILDRGEKEGGRRRSRVGREESGTDFQSGRWSPYSRIPDS
ncbi:hypothetical protein V6N13_008671 [Hibiscus sabdariffa]